MTLTAHPPFDGGSVEGRGGGLPEGVTVSLLPSGCVLCTVAVPADDVRDALSEALGIALLAGPGAVTTGQGDRWAIWLTPRSWLVSADDEMAVAAAVAARFPDRAAHASAYGDAIGWLVLSGSGAEDLLRSGSFLTLEAGGFPVGHAKRTPIADVPVLVWRQGVERWRLGIERSRVAWFVDWLRSADGGT